MELAYVRAPLAARDRAGRVYKPAIGPRLRPLLWVILIGFALLAANGFYLSSVTALTWYLGTTQQTFFYMLMVALHLFLGLVLVIPFLIFGFAHLATSWKRPNKCGHSLRPDTAGRRRWSPWFRDSSWFALADSRSATRGSATSATGSTWPRRWRPLALYVKHRLAGPRIRWEWARRLAIPVVGLRGDHGALALARPQVVRRQGAEGGQAVLLTRPRRSPPTASSFRPGR